jgi:hypothetical protein
MYNLLELYSTMPTTKTVHKMTPGTASRKATATTTNLPTTKGVSFAKADLMAGRHEQDIRSRR